MSEKLVEQEKKSKPSFEYRSPNGTLIAIGGSENKGEEPDNEDASSRNLNFVKNEILKRFVQELPGKDPLIVVIPTASSIPEEIGNTYVQVFRELKVNNVKVLDIRSREDSCKE